MTFYFQVKVNRFSKALHQIVYGFGLRVAAGEFHGRGDQKAFIVLLDYDVELFLGVIF